MGKIFRIIATVILLAGYTVHSQVWLVSQVAVLGDTLDVNVAYTEHLYLGDSTTGSNIARQDSFILHSTDTAFYSRGRRIAVGASVSGGGGGASTYLDLTDTDNDYTDKGLEFLRINEAENAVESAVVDTLAQGDIDVDGFNGALTADGTPINTQYAQWTSDTTLKGINLSTDAWLLADTVILASFNASDSLNTSFFYGSFYNGGSDTLVVTEMIAVLQGSSPSVAVDIEWHATFASGSAVGLNTTPPTITSTTTGDSDTSFDNDQIPPGVFVWCKTPTVTTEPTYMSVTLLGYRLNRSY